MSGIVKYNNDMNLVQFNKFKDKELDLFFSICYKLKEQGTDEISLDFSELKVLSQHSRKDRMIKDLKNTYDKLLALNFEIRHSEISFTKFVLFTKYKVNGEDSNIEIAVNKEFKYILNQLGTTYTKFELEQFVSLKSTYSKNLFKILKQWESVNEKKIEIKEFRRILNIPESYNLSKINEKVLKPILKELSPYFSDFKLEKIKNGRTITHLKFTWSSKKHEIKEAEIIEIVISEKINNAIDKAKKNRFIAKLLNDDNIKILIDKFNEKDLIKGLLWAYKEIKKDISSLNYLIKSIKIGAEQTEKKIVIQNEIVPPKEDQLKIEKVIIEDLGVISEKELEEARQLYLEQTNTKVFDSTHEKIFNSTKNIYIKEIKTKKNDDENNHPPTPPSTTNIDNSMFWTDEQGRQVPKPFKSWEDMENYRNVEYPRDNPKRMKELEQKKEENRNEYINRNSYINHLKEIEFNLILNNDPRVEEFKENYMRFFRLYDFISEEYSVPNAEILEKANQEIERLQGFFEQFESKEVIKIKDKIIDIIDIPGEKLLSKKGSPLFGGALVSRLGSIARDLKCKIKYKDKIIDGR